MKRNKKTVFLAMMLALSMALAACSNTPQLIEEPNESNNDADAPTLAENTLLTVGTSSSGGAVYAVGAGLARILTEKIGNLDMRAVATGGAVDNVNLMSTGEVQVALNAANINYMAASGTLSGVEKQDNLRAICTLYPSVIHFLVSKNSGITSFDQLEGTSGAVGAAGSGSECYSYDILKYYGYDYREKKDIEPVFTASSGAVDLFKDGHIDWAFFPLGVPGANVLDLAMAGKINILPIEGEDRDNIINEYGYYSPYTIPGGTYQGFDEDIDTIACTITLTVDASVDEETVYQITKCIWENIGEVQQITDALKWMSQDTAVSGLGVELHPGAERYYKEIGWIA